MHIFLHTPHKRDVYPFAVQYTTEVKRRIARCDGVTMSGARYRRATKNHAVRVDHTDGSVTKGFVPVPMGMDFVGAMMQAQHFMHFETDDGELTLMNVASIKRITSTETEDGNEKAEAASAAEAARAKREAENARQREAEEEAAQAEQQKSKPADKTYRTGEEYDALEILGLKASATKDEIASAYRKLVKLYHPDRLRGLGVSPKKIEFAAERLSEINNAYRVLMAAAKAA